MTQAQVQQSRIMDMVAALFFKDIEAALRNQISSFIDWIKEVGVEQARNRMDLFFINKGIGEEVWNLYKRAALPIARWNYERLKEIIDRASIQKGLIVLSQPSFEFSFETKRGFGFNEQWTREIEAFFNKYLLNKVVLPITETTKQQILEILNKAFQEGWGVDRIVAELNSPDLTRWRARMIVRTESVRATNYASFLAAHEFDYEMQKTWLEVKDMRTRFTHRHASGVGGEVRDLFEKYSNGLMFPGDPNGRGRETINCRCVNSVKPKRDAKGRLIPIKHKVPVNVMLEMARGI